jgi:hypothetical protein
LFTIQDIHTTLSFPRLSLRLPADGAAEENYSILINYVIIIKGDVMNFEKLIRKILSLSEKDEEGAWTALLSFKNKLIKSDSAT